MKNITVIGEVLFDQYPDYKKLGGAPFNFAYHINQLLGNVNFISAVGNDDNGKSIIDFMKKNDFDSSNIQVNDHGTGIVKVELDDDKIPTYNIIKDRAYDFISLESIKGNSNNELFYIGTLSQRNEVSRNTIQKLIENETKVFYDVNLRQDFYNKEILNKSLRKSNIVKLNSDELDKLIEIFEIKKRNIIDQDAINLKEKFNLDILIVTQGEEGSLVFGDVVSHQKEKVIDIVDTVGAGDAYSAMFCAAYLMGKELDLCNKLAVSFAAKICSIEGAIPENENIYKSYMGKIR